MASPAPSQPSRLQNLACEAAMGRMALGRRAYRDQPQQLGRPGSLQPTYVLYMLQR